MDASDPHWLDWHREYDDPSSSLSRRRRVVQGFLRQILAELAPADPTRLPPANPTRLPPADPIRLLSMCAGDGADVLEVLASPRSGLPIRALLVELDPELADRARAEASRLGLAEVRVRTADAGQSASYAELAPAHIVLACGVFGNISFADVRRTIDALPGLLRPGGQVIWTRGRGVDGDDASQAVRQLFARTGLYRTGLHRTGRCQVPGGLAPARCAAGWHRGLARRAFPVQPSLTLRTSTAGQVHPPRLTRRLARPPTRS